ncbi:uncharacterized protein [Hyperolius riggenbachi]|uniref:uncharacterized protein isoform X2 n=1 Tax=Hyperolius riggenbachi TaxID=752182 RepID=UPI0035A3328D
MKSASKKVQKDIQEAPKCTEDIKQVEPNQEGEEHTHKSGKQPTVPEQKDVMVFEGLCEQMLSALCLLQTSVTEVLDVKDELVRHNVPSGVQAQLSLSTSRLFRSTELVRLVRVFGPDWEQKRMILEQLQGEHERLQRLLSLALQRVQHLETQLHRDAESQHYRNWEKLFIRLMSMGQYKDSPGNLQDLQAKSGK